MNNSSKKGCFGMVPALVAVLALAGVYSWFNPAPSDATLNLRKTLEGVTGVRVRVGCMSGDGGSSKIIVLNLKGPEARSFIQSLQVHRDKKMFAPASCNFFTFEFYKHKILMTEIGYFPGMLVWSKWNDGYFDSGRALNYSARRQLNQLLAPYEDIRKANRR